MLQTSLFSPLMLPYCALPHIRFHTKASHVHPQRHTAFHTFLFLRIDHCARSLLISPHPDCYSTIFHYITSLIQSPSLHRSNYQTMLQRRLTSLISKPLFLSLSIPNVLTLPFLIWPSFHFPLGVSSPFLPPKWLGNPTYYKTWLNCHLSKPSMIKPGEFCLHLCYEVG